LFMYKFVYHLLQNSVILNLPREWIYGFTWFLIVNSDHFLKKR
jgi:hypothetical protein